MRRKALRKFAWWGLVTLFSVVGFAGRGWAQSATSCATLVVPALVNNLGDICFGRGDGPKTFTQATVINSGVTHTYQWEYATSPAGPFVPDVNNTREHLTIRNNPSYWGDRWYRRIVSFSNGCINRIQSPINIKADGRPTIGTSDSDLEYCRENEIFIELGDVNVSTGRPANDWEPYRDSKDLPPGNYICIVQLPASGRRLARVVTLWK